MYILGSKIDYVETKFKSQVTFTNPNEKANCGCGKSFSVSQFKINKGFKVYNKIFSYPSPNIESLRKELGKELSPLNTEEKERRAEIRLMRDADIENDKKVYSRSNSKITARY